MIYTIPTDSITNEPSTTIICRTNEDGTQIWIPCVEGNSDYQAYLAYVANGNQTPTIQ